MIRHEKSWLNHWIRLALYSFSSLERKTRLSRMLDARSIQASTENQLRESHGVIALFVWLMSTKFCTFNNVDLSTKGTLLLNIEIESREIEYSSIYRAHLSSSTCI